MTQIKLINNLFSVKFINLSNSTMKKINRTTKLLEMKRSEFEKLYFNNSNKVVLETLGIKKTALNIILKTFNITKKKKGRREEVEPKIILVD